MNNLYNVNGLMFWNQTEINLRNAFISQIFNDIQDACLKLNQAFHFIQVEAPIITPRDLLNSNYTEEDIYVIDDNLCLRPETTMGSYSYAKHLLAHHEQYKPKLPLVIWQHGKSFRREQDQVTKNMRLKEFYQLEFQIIYSKTTSNDYSVNLIEAVKASLGALISNNCVNNYVYLIESDRLPSYSSKTIDCMSNNMEICSISQRHDLEGYNNIEIAIGTDRLIYQKLHGRNEIKETNES